jgi:hypothetical protein
LLHNTFYFSSFFSPQHKFLFKISASHKNSYNYYYPSVSHPQQRVVLFAPIKQEREREIEREIERERRGPSSLHTFQRESELHWEKYPVLCSCRELIIKAITIPQFPSVL